jgi:N-acetylgalactosamine 4-sulfate 6-O-sulfotransferase
MWGNLRHHLEQTSPDITKYLPASGYDPKFKNPCWWQNEPPDEPFSRTRYSIKYLYAYSNPKNEVSQGDGPHLFCLPYFFLLGMAKCGTTDLYRRMMEHPQIAKVPPSLKEPHWWNFNRHHKATFLDYTYFFSAAAKQIRNASDHGIQMVTGDATATTMSDYPVSGSEDSHEVYLPGQIYSVFPGVKLIAILRDPVERFYSDYVFFICSKPLNMQRTKIEFNPRCSQEDFHKHAVSLIQLFQRCLETSSLQFCTHRVASSTGYVSVCISHFAKYQLKC